MIIIKSVLVSLMIVFGVICSYTDIKENIILNKVVFLGLALSLMACTVYFILAGTTDLLKFVIMVVLSAVIGILMYILHIWAGGDVKFFILLSLLIPADLIKQSSPVAILSVFVFIFVIAFVFLLFQSLYLAIKKENSPTKLTMNISIKQLLSSIVIVMAMQTVLKIVFGDLYFKYLSIFLFLNVLVILSLSKVKWIKNNMAIIVFSIISVIGLIINIKNGQFSLDLKNMVVAILVIVFRGLAERYNYKEINTSNVKQGVILSYGTVIGFMNSRVKGLPLSTTEDIASRITVEEAESIKRWENSKTGKSTIVVLRKVPFAIFIFLGYLIYLLIGIFVW